MAKYRKENRPQHSLFSTMFNGPVRRPTVRPTVAHGLTGYLPKHLAPRRPRAISHGGIF